MLTDDYPLPLACCRFLCLVASLGALLDALRHLHGHGGKLTTLRLSCAVEGAPNLRQDERLQVTPGQ